MTKIIVEQALPLPPISEKVKASSSTTKLALSILMMIGIAFAMGGLLSFFGAGRFGDVGLTNQGKAILTAIGALMASVFGGTLYYVKTKDNA